MEGETVRTSHRVDPRRWLPIIFGSSAAMQEHAAAQLYFRCAEAGEYTDGGPEVRPALGIIGSRVSLGRLVVVGILGKPKIQPGWERALRTRVPLFKIAGGGKVVFRSVGENRRATRWLVGQLGAPPQTPERSTANSGWSIKQHKRRSVCVASRPFCDKRYECRSSRMCQTIMGYFAAADLI